MTNEQRREYARMLYIKENLTQADIAERTGVSRQTINKWIKDGHWEDYKASYTMTRDQQIANLQRQIAAMNDAIAARGVGENFATPAEADTINKIAQAIKKLESETGLSDIISVGIQFLDFIRPLDLEKSKEFTRLWDQFVKKHM